MCWFRYCKNFLLESRTWVCANPSKNAVALFSSVHLREVCQWLCDTKMLPAGEGHVWRQEGGMGDGDGSQPSPRPRWGLSRLPRPRHSLPHDPDTTFRSSFICITALNFLSRLTFFTEVFPNLRSFPHPECKLQWNKDPICLLTPLCSLTGQFLVYGRAS